MNVELDIKKLEYPPQGIGTVIGDTIHNLRSALDLMACDLVRKNGGSTKSVYFPFAESETELNAQITSKKFHRAGADCVQLLKSFRPWRGGNEALRAIHDLDVMDKHSIVLPAIFLVITDELALFTDSLGLKGEAITPSSVSFVFPKNSPLAGQPLIPTLHHLFETVKSILEAFAALVFERG